MPDHRPPRLRRALVVALAITAVAAPAASARLAPEAVSSDRNPPPVMVTESRDSVPGPTVTRTIADDGLDWGSAALGAGGAVALLVLAAGSGSAVVRHRQHVGSAS